MIKNALLIILVIAITWVYFYSNNSPEFKIIKGNFKQEKSGNMPVGKNILDKPIMEQVKIITAITTEKKSHFVSLLSWSVHEDEIRQWQASNLGYYYSGALPSDYDVYKIETLKLMGEQGDLKALDMLAHKFRINNDYVNAAKAYNKAAAFGSTYALIQLGAMQYNTAVNDEERFLRSLDQLAYHQAAILRGDIQVLYAASATIEYLPKKLMEDDFVVIQEKGTKIYQDLENRRKMMGLGKFEDFNKENSYPENIKGYYKSVRENFINTSTNVFSNL